MSDEDVRKLVEHLQAQADAMRDQPIEIQLANQPGPYQLPKCTSVGLIIHSPNKAELLLHAETGQQIQVEIDTQVMRTLHELTKAALNRPHNP